MSNTRYIAPASNIPRPQLPVEHINPQLQRIDPSKSLPVKFQEISRDGHVALVGRMKIPTPSGHAFILRRLDTEAISLTTMFRAAFPAASDEAEKAELAWIKSNYDLSGANKSGKSRFAGTWATIDVALAIADTYSISHLLPPLIEAKPDPSQTYSKDKRANKSISTPLTPQATPPSPAKANGPNKRRKQASPPPQPSPAQAVISPRRSTRLKSPVPAAVPLPLSPRRTPKRIREEEAVVRETQNLLAEVEAMYQQDQAQPEVESDPLMAQEIEEQIELVQKLKEERARQDQDDQMADNEPASNKRTIDEVEPPLLLNIKEPEVELGVRKLATNNRVRVYQGMAPERKSLAWGVAAFAAGIGAILLPNLWL